MGNNQTKLPRVRRARVQEVRSIRISHLRAMGLLKPGERTRHLFPGAANFAYCCNMHDEPHCLCIEDGSVVQIIRLVTRKTGRGLRCYFQDRNGIVCEKLYLHQGHYVSRQTAGLAYLSQVQNKLDRTIARAKRISWAILGKPGKGPARGRSRERKLAKLDIAKTELEKISKIIERERRKPRRTRKGEVLRALSLASTAKESSGNN
jgi:hypothetical protein